MKNLLSLYRAMLLLTQDVSGVSQQVTLKGAQLVKLFCTVGAHVRYNKVAVISCSDILSCLPLYLFPVQIVGVWYVVSIKCLQLSLI